MDSRLSFSISRWCRALSRILSIELNDFFSSNHFEHVIHISNNVVVFQLNGVV